MSVTTTMSVPGIELAQLGQREQHATPFEQAHGTPHQEQNHRTSHDHRRTIERPQAPSHTITLAAQDASRSAPIPTVRLTASTEQSDSTSTQGGRSDTPEGSVDNASLRQAGSGPPSPAPLSTQPTLVLPSISSVHTSQSNRPSSSFETLFPELSRIVKADSIHYQRTRHLLGKIFSLTTIVVTLLGVFIYSMRAYVLAKWTSAKDFWEYCSSPGTHDTHCKVIEGKHLAAPPYDSERFFLNGRSLSPFANAAPKSTSHLWIIAMTLVPILLIAAFLLVYFTSTKHSKSRTTILPSPNDCNVRTQIPISWATDPNRNICLDKSYSTSTATDLTHRSTSLHDASTRHPSLEGPQQPVKRLKISSNLKATPQNGSSSPTAGAPPRSSHACDHEWYFEWRAHGWRDFCKKCKKEVVDGPTHTELKEKHAEWEEKRAELREELRVDVEDRRNRASIALHKTGDTLMKIINREPLDGAREAAEKVGEMRVAEGGVAEIELSPARLGALGLMR